MPNQRSKDKVYLGGFIDRELQERLLREAKKAGMEKNKFGFASLLIREALTGRKGAKPVVAKGVKPTKVAAPARARAKPKTAAKKSRKR
jgi:hypothetical protein